MKKIILIILATTFFANCSKHSNPTPVTPAPPAPKAALLSLPAQNSACITGQNITSTTSDVSFSWAVSTNTDSYVLYVTNLTTNNVASTVTESPMATMTLARGVAFSWYVVSRSKSSPDTAKSVTWKFYNAGTAQTNYAPFPAELISPTYGQQITATGDTTTLSWSGSAVQNNIKNYDVYIGTSTNPGLYRNAVTTPYLKGVGVSSGNTYYWMIVTWDTNNNSTPSQIYSFAVK